MFKTILSLKNELLKKESSFSIQRFTLIGSTLFMSKVVLILVAYFFDKNDYNIFNKAYYTASILILFGSLGFEYALLRVKVKLPYLFMAVAFNSLATLGILAIVSPTALTTSESLSVYLYSLFACLGGIFTFGFLFGGDYKKYFMLMVLNSLFHIAIIPAVKVTGLSIFSCFPFITGAWLLIAVSLTSKHANGQSNIKELYKVGASTFIINSSASFALVADKYIVNHFFTLNIANAYTFSWALTVPLFYIGNLIEKIIFSSADIDSPKVVKKSLPLLMLLILSYLLCVTLVVYFFSEIIPASVDLHLLREIFLFMITGYSVYVLFHFPLNGYLFKFLNVDVQKLIAKYSALSISILVIAFLVFIGLFGISDFRFLLSLVWIYIFVLLFIKWRLIIRSKNVEPA